MICPTSNHSINKIEDRRKPNCLTQSLDQITLDPVINSIKNDAQQIFFDAEENKSVPHQLTKRCATDFTCCASLLLFIASAIFRTAYYFAIFS